MFLRGGFQSMSPKYVDKEKTRSNLGSADWQLKFIEINSFFFEEEHVFTNRLSPQIMQYILLVSYSILSDRRHVDSLITKYGVCDSILLETCKTWQW